MEDIDSTNLNIYKDQEETLLYDFDHSEFSKEDYVIQGSIKRHLFYSKALDNKRYIDIYLPPSYFSNPFKSYPVLYMHDGNNLFDPSTAFGGVHWRVDSTVEYLISNNIMEEIIVVGIHNTPNRDYEYTWTSMYLDYENVKQGGGGYYYANFIINELKPFIDYKYRTLPFKETTGVMGSSLGGVISFYLGLNYPNIFTKIGIISPSLWWGNGIMFKHAKKMDTNLSIWLDMGTKEDDSDYNFCIRSTRKMRKILQNLGYVEGNNLGYYEHKDAEHNEWYWGERLHLPLIFFFGK